MASRTVTGESDHCRGRRRRSNRPKKNSQADGPSRIEALEREKESRIYHIRAMFGFHRRMKSGWQKHCFCKQGYNLRSRDRGGETPVRKQRDFLRVQEP